MPQSAITAGAVDLALRPAEIAERLAGLAQHPYLRTTGHAETRALDDSEQFRRVISALRKNTGVDFSQYRDTTIKRRTARRMLVRGQPSLADYANVLEADRDEAEALYRDVLINVTSFFRDPELFDDLKRDVFPEIVKQKRPSEPIRIWVPGCSTGQEAYSIAMTLVEFLEAEQAQHPIQIFATDLGDPESLDKARAGLYPESIEAEVSPERLRRFFVRGGPFVPDLEGTARALRICPPEPHGRSAILARGPRELPQRADLHVAGAAAATAARVPLRLESKRLPGARAGGIGRAVWRPVPGRESQSTRFSGAARRAIGRSSRSRRTNGSPASRPAACRPRRHRSRTSFVSPNGSSSTLMVRRACSSTRISMCSSTAAAPRRSSSRLPGNRRPICCAWRRKACSRTCAAR